MRFVLMAIALLAAPAAMAEDLVLGITGQVGYQDNVFFSSQNPESGLPFRLIPFVELQRPQGDLTYRLRAQLSREDYFDLDGADTTDQLLRLTGTWRATPVTDVTFSETFTRAQSLLRRLEELDPSQATDDLELVPDLEITRVRSIRNAANLGVEHQLSQRWVFQARATQSLLDFQDERFFDSESYGGTASLSYRVTPRDRLGLGMGASRQEFTGSTGQASGGTSFYRVFALWRHHFSPTFDLNVQVGPTLVDPDTGEFPTSLDVPQVAFREVTPGDFRLVNPLTCPVLGDGSGLVLLTAACGVQGDPLDESVVQTLEMPVTVNLAGTAPKVGGQRTTYFARVTLTRRWETVTSSLTYDRSESSSSGLGRSTVQDALTGRVVWRPSRRWNLSLAGSWSRQASAADQAFNVVALQATLQDVDGDGNNEIVGVPDSLRLVEISTDDSFTLMQLLARAERSITRRVSVFGLAVLRRQENSFGRIGSDTQADAFEIFLGIRWQTDRIQL